MNLNGIFAPVTTPFSSDGGLDLDALAQNIDRYARTPLNGYLVLGSNGENKSLSREERLAVLHTVIRHRRPGQTVMAGCIEESTRETIFFSREAERLGADALTLLPPSYFKSQMNTETLIRYFTDVADAVHTPCLLYKAPQFSGGVDISPDVLRACADHPNIVGIKDSSGGAVEKVLACVPDSFRVLSGSANTLFPALCAGACGGVISLADSFPEWVCGLYSAFREGDWEGAVALNREIVRVNLVVSGACGVAGVKYAMDAAGYRGGAPRLPLLPLASQTKQSIRAALAAAELITLPNRRNQDDRPA